MREISQAATLMYALVHALFTYLQCGSYATAKSVADELLALADEKGSLSWRGLGMIHQGCLFSLTGKAPDAVGMIASGLTAWRSTGSTVWAPLYSANLATAHSQLGQFDDAWRCIGEAMTSVETTKEKWSEAEVNRMAGEIALLSPQPDAPRAEAYFERALAVARQQQAKSWELRASMSLARLWRDQGKVQKARELLAPVYGWFTEGFDTRDLKEAKTLLEQLSA
jgi:predicted ATPase